MESIAPGAEVQLLHGPETHTIIGTETVTVSYQVCCVCRRHSKAVGQRFYREGIMVKQTRLSLRRSFPRRESCIKDNSSSQCDGLGDENKRRRQSQ